MKNILTLTVLFVFLIVGVVQARTWTDSRGNKLIGDFVGFSQNDDTKIKIKTTTGRVLFVPIKGLSQEDQDYVQSLKENNNAQKNSSGFQSDSLAPAPAQRNNNNGSPVELQPVDNNPNNEVVIVEGIGDNIAEAKKDAMRNAVEQVVGALVDAQTRVENDELIEQILTASGAYSEKSEVLSAKKENGLVTIKLRATVVKLSLTKKLKLGGGGQTLAVDGANLVDLASSKVDAEKSGAMFLANFLKKEEFPYSLLDTKVIEKPSITQKGNEVIYTLKVEASVNRERYMDFVKRVKPIFDKYAIQQSSFVLEPKNTNSRITYEYKVMPGNEYKGEHLPFYLCTGVMGNFRSLKFDTYELPKKFTVPLGYYKRIAPVIEVLLLDGDNEVVATKRTMLGTSYSIEPFNVMPSLLRFSYNYYFDNPNAIGESTILGYRNGDYSKEYVEVPGWCALAPYRSISDGPHDGFIVPSYSFDVLITLTPDELAKVRSAKIAVIVNNPEMDKAFERMEKEIDQIPTN